MQLMSPNRSSTNTNLFATFTNFQIKTVSKLKIQVKTFQISSVDIKAHKTGSAILTFLPLLLTSLANVYVLLKDLKLELILD